MNTRNFKEMTAEEQCRWIMDFNDWVPQGQRLAKLNTDWTREDRDAMERGLQLLSAWTFAQDYCEKAMHFGDYHRRAYRLAVYIEKVKEMLSALLTVTNQDGRVYAVVAPGTPLRRRGRPTLEEQKAKQRGDAFVVKDDSTETRKSLAIAELLGIEVVITGEAPREKNNAELAQERAARKAEYEKQNPSLFPNDTQPRVVAKCASVTSAPEVAAREVTNPAKAVEGHGDDRSSVAAEAVSPCAQLMNDSYEARMAQDKLHLDQLAWLMSKPLQERVKLVQSQRTAAEAASERAKMLAEMGGKQKEIEEYAEQAKVATEAYLQTYADVDEELAVLHKRLYLDVPFVDGFKKRFKGVDIEKIQYITRPYYEKVKKESPEIDVRIRTIIEQENPEYAAKMKAEQEKKEELQQLHRYIMRTDKPASDERVKTMTERIERVRQLAGDEVANSYLPVLEKTKEENAALNKAKAEKSRPTPDPSLSGRGVDTPADEAADEKKPKKSAKQSTKQQSKKTKKS